MSYDKDNRRIHDLSEVLGRHWTYSDPFDCEGCHGIRAARAQAEADELSQLKDRSYRIPNPHE